MKIKNDLVSVKIGNKQYDFRNLILDEYLKRFAKSQIDKSNIDKRQYDRRLEYCLLKFDTPLNINSSSEFHNSDFDVCFVFGMLKFEQEISQNQISVKYMYETDDILYDYSSGTATDNYISNYYGKKITAIGFNTYWIDDSKYDVKIPVCAVLDTSNYNMYIQPNQSLSIVRKDIISTDCIFSTNNNRIEGPVHLAPFGLPQVIKQDDIYNEAGTNWNSFYDYGYGILYSAGLSSYTDYIDKEYVLGDDIQVEQNNSEIIIKGLKNYLNIDHNTYSSLNLYPSENLYTVKHNYKYIILKYKIWQQVHTGTYGNIVTTTTDTGLYYYQAIPIDKFGKSNVKIKYERG